MVAAVFNVVIFPLAVRAHGKGLHGSLRPVIGNVLDDGQTRAAVGAVNKRIAIAAVLRIQQLPQTVGADGDIRGDEGVTAGLPQALYNRKIRKVLRRNFPHRHILDDGEGRRFPGQRLKKGLQRFLLPFQLHRDAGRGIADIPLQGMLPHQAVHKRAKAHPLDDSPDFDLKCLHCKKQWQDPPPGRPYPDVRTENALRFQIPSEEPETVRQTFPPPAGQ